MFDPTIQEIFESAIYRLSLPVLEAHIFIVFEVQRSSIKLVSKVSTRPINCSNDYVTSCLIVSSVISGSDHNHHRPTPDSLENGLQS